MRLSSLLGLVIAVGLPAPAGPPESFRILPGRFHVFFLHPDGSALKRQIEAASGVLDIPFPAGDWNISGHYRPLNQLAEFKTIEAP